MPSTRLIMSVSTGFPDLYPFDEYETDPIYLRGEIKVNGTWRNAQLHMTLKSPYIFNWRMEDNVMDISEYHDGSLITTTLRFYRSFTTKFFAIFLTVSECRSNLSTCSCVVISILGLFVFGLSLSIWHRNRKVEPPTLGIPTSFLFVFVDSLLELI